MVWHFEKCDSAVWLDSVGQYYDPHLDGKFQLDILKDVLGALTVTRGKFPDNPGVCLAGGEFSQMLDSSSEHTYLGRKLNEVDYDKKSDLEKMRSLRTVYMDLDD